MTRRLIAMLTAVALLIELLFPPFNPPSGWRGYPLVYWFLFSPPGVQDGGRLVYGAVNVELLAIELLTTLAIGLLLIFFVARE